jgi:POT family proton-dependent oligopeptide transporter
MEQHINMKQPRELYILFFTEMWERFNYYGMRALLVLYMVYDLFVNKRGFGDTQAYAIYAAYGSLVYATPYIGGILADKVLGYKKSIIFGGIMMAIGEFLMMIHSEYIFYFALSFIIVGNGFFKPNISSIVGGLYKDDDPRRDGGFTIFYMGINMGAAIAPILTAVVMDVFGFQYAFGLAGVGMVAGLITFILGKAKLGDNGNPPNYETLHKKTLGITNEFWVYIFSITTVPVFMYLIFFNKIMDIVFPLFGLFVLGSLLYNAFKVSKVERERLFVIIILVLFTIMFWSFFEQAGSSLTLYTELNINRWVGNWQIPTPLFQSVNAFFIIVLAPVFASMWIKLAERGKEPSTPLKFALGLIMIGLAFGSLVIGKSFAENGLVPLFFIILIYFMNTLGELSLSPVGLSMVTKLSPKRMVGMVMGAWMLAVAFAQFFGGMIAKYTSTDEYMEAAVNYAPKLGVDGNDTFVFNLFDEVSNTQTQDIKVNVQISNDVKATGVAYKPDAFEIYKSLKPGAEITQNLRIKHLDPLGDLTTISVPKAKAGNVTVNGDMLTYKALSDSMLVDTIEWTITEIEDTLQSDLVRMILTIDNLENHPPVAKTAVIDAVAWKKPWYTRSDVIVNVLDFAYDPDGDALIVKITQKPDAERATVKTQNNLNTFVGPNKTVHIYTNVFGSLSIIAVAVGVLLLFLVPILKKWMHGIH